MSRRLALDGSVYGRLTVVGFSHCKKGRSYFTCHCSCGNILTIGSSALQSGNTKSCGCLKKEMEVRHGHTRSYKQTLTYNAWKRVRRSYKAFDPEWQKFDAFLKDLGECPPGHVLAIREGAKIYNRENCWWLSKDVNFNKLRSNNE